MRCYNKSYILIVDSDFILNVVTAIEHWNIHSKGRYFSIIFIYKNIFKNIKSKE